MKDRIERDSPASLVGSSGSSETSCPRRWPISASLMPSSFAAKPCGRPHLDEHTLRRRLPCALLSVVGLRKRVATWLQIWALLLRQLPQHVAQSHYMRCMPTFTMCARVSSPNESAFSLRCQENCQGMRPSTLL